MSATETESKSWLSHTQQSHHTSPFAWQSYFAYATKTHAKTYSCTGNINYYIHTDSIKNTKISDSNEVYLLFIWYILQHCSFILLEKFFKNFWTVASPKALSDKKIGSSTFLTFPDIHGQIVSNEFFFGFERLYYQRDYLNCNTKIFRNNNSSLRHITLTYPL